MTIKLRPDQKIKVKNAESLYRVMRELLVREKGIDKNRERGWVASLAANDTLLNLELITLGATHSAIIEPSAVFAIALQKDSKGVVIIHSHPSGKAEPSISDDNLTELMLAVGELVKCPVLDHMIVTETDYFSYAQSGRLNIFREAINPSDPRLKSEVIRLRNELIDRNAEIQELKNKLKTKQKPAAKKKPAKKAGR